MEAIHVLELKVYGINFRNLFLNSAFSELFQIFFGRKGTLSKKHLLALAKVFMYGKIIFF